jgi:hypothetical protein
MFSLYSPPHWPVGFRPIARHEVIQCLHSGMTEISKDRAARIVKHKTDLLISSVTWLIITIAGTVEQNVDLQPHGCSHEVVTGGARGQNR